ncbi:MAG: transporter substrate-binding domain-containing protein [Rhodospirillales bacterium]|nr:transporter substrate-binding domain-containing protein [Alphaproteobacteria bacterium]MCB9986667.1 transporter substrate-binding domain-containing protein [Rhodospirillales bacterium]USO06806.1 MAG: transporter substrate-binding domain-containing protein [Rhodospirillales bacterium]
MKNFFLALFLFLLSLPAFAQDGQESSFDRVVRTHTLRCAYTVYPPFVQKDPNSGVLSGINYALVEEMGKQLGIKIEWGPEVGADVAFEGIGRAFDANCTGYSPAPTRTFAVAFSRSLFYSPYTMYVRADETRFKTLEDFNKESVKLATLDGEFSQIVAREQMPKAKTLQFPALTSHADRIEAVISDKADGLPLDASIGAEYMAKNPGRIKPFPIPLRVVGCGIALPHGEPDLKGMIDVTVDALQQTGALARIIKENTPYPETILLPAKPYADN